MLIALIFIIAVCILLGIVVVAQFADQLIHFAATVFFALGCGIVGWMIPQVFGT